MSNQRFRCRGCDYETAKIHFIAYLWPVCTTCAIAWEDFLKLHNDEMAITQKFHAEPCTEWYIPWIHRFLKEQRKAKGV